MHPRRGWGQRIVLVFNSVVIIVAVLAAGLVWAANNKLATTRRVPIHASLPPTTPAPGVTEDSGASDTTLDLSGDVSSGLVLVAARTWCKLGDVCTQQGKAELAIEAYRVARKDLPEDPDVANNLAYLLTTRPAGCEEAAELARTAVELAEKQRVSESVKKSYLDTLGTAELCLGHYEEAETAFRMGLKIDGDAMDLNIGLAETLVGRGQLEAAQQALDHIARLPQTQSPELQRRLSIVRGRLEASR